MSRQIRTSHDLEQLAREIMAKARLRAQQEDHALKRALGSRVHEWLNENSEGSEIFLNWLNNRVVDAPERRALTPILNLLKVRAG